MPARRSFFPACLAPLLACICLNVGEAALLRAGGTGGATGMLEALGAAYERDRETRLVVIPSLGSGGGLRALGAGELDIAVSGRPLHAKEAAAGLSVIAVLKTPYGFVTSRANPPGLRSADIAALIKAHNPAWPDGMPLRVVRRPPSDSDSELIASLFPGMKDALEQIGRRPDIPVAATDQDNADMAEKISGSLVGATFIQVRTEKRRLSFVPIDDAVPTLETFQSGTWPYSKTLYVVVADSRNPVIQSFLSFLHSPAGRASLREAGALLSGEP